jgi:hypothetical protein
MRRQRYPGSEGIQSRKERRSNLDPAPQELYTRPFTELVSTPTYYDRAMIQDWLAHLRCELLVARSAIQDGPEAVDPNLLRWLRALMERHPACLVVVPRLLLSGLPAEQVIRAASGFREYWRREIMDRVRYLEALTDLFDEALACSDQPHVVYCDQDGREWLQHRAEDEGK